MRLESDNEVIRQTVSLATKNTCLHDQLKISNELALNQILPVSFNQNMFTLARSLGVEESETSVRHRFSVYTDKRPMGLVSCFAKKRKTKNLVIYSRCIGIYTLDDELQTFVNLNTCNISIRRGVTDIRVYIQDGKESKPQEIYIQPENEQQKERIDEVLTYMKESSSDNKDYFNYIHSFADSLQCQCITEGGFRTKCDSGDLLLFKLKPTQENRSNGTTTSMSTPVLIEHVAIVIRNLDNQILVVEKNSQGKIGINYWQNIVNLGWFTKTERVTYRKLDIQKTQEFTTSLQNWLVTQLDRHFDTGIAELYGIHRKQKVVKEAGTKATYQCCNFVTQCYKSIGLLDIPRQSIQFWPIDFTQLRQLPFTHGMLGPQQLIVFKMKQTTKTETIVKTPIPVKPLDLS